MTETLYVHVTPQWDRERTEEEIDRIYDGEYSADLEFAGKHYTLPIGEDADLYPKEIDGKLCFWCWEPEDTEYTLSFARYLEENHPRTLHWNAPVLKDFDIYGQWRSVPTLQSELIHHIFNSLEERDYLKRYLLYSDDSHPSWRKYTKREDGSVGLFLCDKNAWRDKLLVARINALLNACESHINENDEEIPGILEETYVREAFYYLQDEQNQTYISREPGALGGHYKLKIYGRLDCPSANRYLKQGKYVKHRVFFKDEATAIAAGYRPCGVCMPEAYRKWKEGQK